MQEHAFVIPAYKDSPYLEECILSLKNQSVSSAIIITTATPSVYLKNIAEKHGLPYFINENSPSISGDWNFALHKANAKYITIAHQDDIYDNEFSAKVLNAIKRNNESLLGFTDYYEMTGDTVTGNSLNLIVKRILLLPFYISQNIRNRFLKKSVLSIGNPICCPSVTINTQLLQGFQFSGRYACALDWQAWLDAAMKEGSFVYINQKLLTHRIHTASETTNQIVNGRRLLEEKEILQRIWGKPVGSFISDIYKLAQKGNITKA